MADQSNASTAPSANPQRRRLSIADMLNPRANSIAIPSSSPPSAGVPAIPDTAQHRRGASISTVGLTGAGNGQTSPYNAFARQRRASISTSSAASSPEFRNSFGDEPAVIEEDDNSKSSYGSPPSPSFARRVSFGAQALRDVRQSGAGAPNGGRRPSSSLYTLDEDRDHAISTNTRSKETVKATGEGFNWSEALRDRTKRSPSFSTGLPFASRVRPTSNSTAAEPPKEMPKASPTPPKMKKPDHIGERMLRGDFMMD